MTTSSVFRLAAPAVMGALWVAGCGGGKSDPAPSDSLGARTNAAPALALAAAVAPSATDDPAVVAAYRNSFYDDADILHSFQTTVGETIDCIDFYAQRSVKGLVAQGQRPDITKLPKPPPLPGGVPEANVPSHFAFDGSPDLNGNARQCPPGAVAVTRPSVTDITAAGGLEKFKATRRRRPVPSGSQSTFENDCWLNNAPGNGMGFPTYNYDHAVGIVRNINYYGLLTIMPVYAGFIEVAGEHDVSQFWVQTGKCENWYRTSGQGNQCATGNGVNNQAVQSVEGGWVVDNNQQIAKLFMFMTGDGYYQDNCYAGSDGVGDTVCCPGGVSNPSPGQQGTSCWVAAPNAAFTVNESLPTSTAEKPPWELGIQVWNGSTANPPAPGWWVWVNGNNLIGWYPPSTFNWPDGSAGPMANGPATYLQAGGEVYNTWPNNQHTDTAMGSGFAPDSSSHGYMVSSYQRDVMYIDSAGNYHNAPLGYYFAPSYEGDNQIAGLCGFDAASFTQGSFTGGYTLSTSLPAGGSGWGSYFYFGGPIL